MKTMMVRYWNPTYTALNNQIDRLFDDFMGLTDSKATTWTPAIELIEKDDAFVLACYLPGVSVDDTDVQVTQDSISISGVRKPNDRPEGEKTLHSDLAYGQFRRFIQLPTKIQNTKVTAAFEHDVLSLVLPKVEEEKHKVIKLSLGKSPQAITSSEAEAESGDN